MGLVTVSTSRRLDRAKTDPTDTKPANTPVRRPSLRDDSSPVKPTPRARTRGVLPAEFIAIVGRFARLLQPADEVSEVPHVMCTSMMLSCNYDQGDIISCLAMASANVLRQSAEFSQMGGRERAFLAAIHIYLAHVFIFDECVPLRFWHEWVFAKYCSLGCLHRTVGKLLKLMQYRPTVEPDVILHNVAYLLGLHTEAQAAPLKGPW